MPVQTREAGMDELARLAGGGYVYVILDACDAPAVPEKARGLGGEKAISLYNGTSQQEYWAIAPYLFHADAELIGWIQQSLWDEPWGIVAIANVDLATMRGHFRKFLIVESPEGENWYFRFYDPRVLPIFLESSNEEELKAFYGPVQAYGVQEEKEKHIRLLKAS